jgi:hypothetical protein
MKTFGSLLISAALLCSCSVYQSTSVSLDDAQARGKARIIDEAGISRDFEKIVKVDSAYYGIRRSAVKETNYISQYVLIPHATNLKIYLEKPPIYHVWVTLNKKSKANGVLYGVQDSSIWIADPGFMRDYRKIASGHSIENDARFRIQKIQVTDIQHIKIRKLNSIGKGLLLGPVTGVGFGVVVGAGGFEKIIGGAILGIFGVPVGGIVGASKFKIPIQGDFSRYQVNRKHLSPVNWKISAVESAPAPVTLLPINHGEFTHYNGWRAYTSQQEMMTGIKDKDKIRAQRRGVPPASGLIPVTLILWALLVRPFSF